MKRALLAGTLLVSGCGTLTTHEARDPLGRSTLIARTVPDLIDCMGKPDAAMQTGPDTAVLQYTRKDTSTGLKATVTLLGSVEIGGGGGCSVVLTILRDGTVADVAFPGAYTDALFADPLGACRPLVAECLAHPGVTGLPAGYDSFRWVLPVKA